MTSEYLPFPHHPAAFLSPIVVNRTTHKGMVTRHLKRQCAGYRSSIAQVAKQVFLGLHGDSKGRYVHGLPDLVSSGGLIRDQRVLTPMPYQPEFLHAM